MKRVIVVGGGLAGLSSSVFLSENGFHVTLLEASPKLGGRTYTINDPLSKVSYDNGQHILMGCYKETLDYLKKINSIHKLDAQSSLHIPFVVPGGTVFKLHAPSSYYPFNLLYSILNYQALSIKERLGVLSLFVHIMLSPDVSSADISVKDWLKSKRQSEYVISTFWEIITVSALNTPTEKADAGIFKSILKKMFLSGNTASTILMPNTGLSELFVDQAVSFIKSRNGIINISEKVKEVAFAGKRALTLRSDKKLYNEFDFVVFAIPAYSVSKISFTPDPGIILPNLNYSSILNIHLWLKENLFKEKFYGFIGSKIHWLFNHGSHISLTISSAEEYIKMDHSQIKRLFYVELENYFPIFNSESVTDFKIIKEKRATFIPDFESIKSRKAISTASENILFAGDWVNTDLPSTIESAILSGKIAGEKTIKSLK